MGQTIKAGTGLCDIYLDEEKMIKDLSDISLTKEDFIEVSNKNIEDLFKDEDGEDEDDYCNDDDFSFSIS